MDIISEYLINSYRNPLYEYYGAELSQLVRYLKMDDEEKTNELIMNFPWLFSEFYRTKSYSTDIFSDLDADEIERIEEYPEEAWEFITPKQKEEFLSWVSSRPRNEIFPTWYYMSYQGLVKNQWLIHFSNTAHKIENDQKFNYCVVDMTKLGLTKHLTDDYYISKKSEGFGFAYLLDDFKTYGKSNYRRDSWKYGDSAVVFRASGIKVWHYGDREPQVIFLCNSAKNINAITYSENDGTYGFYNKKTGDKLVEFDELEKLPFWLKKHYDQYRKVMY